MTWGSKQARGGQGALGEGAPAAEPRPDRPDDPIGPAALPLALAWAGGLAAAAATFALDLATRGALAVPVLHVVAVLILLGSRRRRAVAGVALLGTGLTLAGAFFVPAGNPLWQLAADRALALVAIWAVAAAGLGALRSAADFLALAAEDAQTRVELRHAQKSRDEYLAMLAHELRGPMAPMRTDLSILAGKIDPLSEAARLRGRVERQLAQLARLTDGLLDVARLTQGQVRLEPRPVDLRRVVETAVESCRPALAERRQELAVRVPERPVTVDGDAARLEQVVANLLANASKYSPEGSHAWVALTVQDGEAAIAVRDDGAGLAADFLPYAFEPFSQAERGADRAAGGLGLGLALVQRVTELHGGRVEAASEGVGHGSTFTVRLPLHRHDGSAENGADPAGNGAAARRRVLVVDDNRDARESLAEWLRMQGYEVVTAAHAQEALERAREAKPEIGLLDIGLPGLDGYQLAGLLREELGEIKLLATSGYGQPEALERSRRAGFDLHLVKPLDLRSLADAIDRE